MVQLIKVKKELKAINTVYLISILLIMIILLLNGKITFNYGFWMRLIFCVWIPFSAAYEIKNIDSYDEMLLAGKEKRTYYFLVIMGNICIIASLVYYLYEMLYREESFASVLLILAYLQFARGISEYLKKLEIRQQDINRKNEGS